MLRQLMFGAVVCMAGVALAADASEDVLNAVKKLNDSSNYSWKTTSESAGGGGFNASQTGKTQKDGYTTVTITFGDNDTQLATKGGKGVVKTDDGWKTAEELADEQGPARFMAMMAQNFKTPGAQAEEASSKLKDFKQEDDAYVATVSGEDAASLFMMGMGRGRRGGAGGQAPQVTNAKVVVKCWIKDGVLSKTELHTTGTISFNGNDMDIDRTTTTEFSDVGNTKVEVPEDAKKKLG